MKTLLTIIALGFVFSLCNLTGKRNDNANSNVRSGNINESAANNSASPDRIPQPPGVTQGSGAPPASSTNRNMSIPPDAEPPLPPKKQATPKSPTPIVSGGVLNGKAISKPQPAYPAIAKAAHASGTVTVQVLVDETGKVVSANAVSGHPLLLQSAAAAARQARFSPTLLSGQPVKVSGVLTYNFVLQ